MSRTGPIAPSYGSYGSSFCFCRSGSPNILSQFEYEGKTLSLESIQPETNGRHLTDMIVDGVLFKDMDPDQVEVLERILMHE